MRSQRQQSDSTTRGYRIRSEKKEAEDHQMACPLSYRESRLEQKFEPRQFGFEHILLSPPFRKYSG